MKKTFKHICEFCKQSYLNADVKGAYCEDCKKPKSCACGCGRFIKYPASAYRNGQKVLYAQGCRNRGKTYSEIYKAVVPTNGFRKGFDNPNYNKEIKARATKSLLTYYRNNPEKVKEKLDKGSLTRGKLEGFRSSWEKEVYDILNSLGYKFIQEEPVKTEDSIKIVDFIIQEVDSIYPYSIFIEVVGLSYLRDPEKAVKKLQKLQETTQLIPVLILTKGIKLKNEIFKTLRSHGFNTNLFIEDYTDLKRTTSALKFCKLVSALATMERNLKI